MLVQGGFLQTVQKLLVHRCVSLLLMDWSQLKQYSVVFLKALMDLTTYTCLSCTSKLIFELELPMRTNLRPSMAVLYMIKQKFNGTVYLCSI